MLLSSVVEAARLANKDMRPSGPASTASSTLGPLRAGKT
jgi:hypothetical protein